MNKDKLKELLKKRNPLVEREAVKPVDLYKRTVKPTVRTERANGATERLDKQVSVLDEIKEGVKDDKRPTERYSFEIYTDQKQKIEDLQYQYKKNHDNESENYFMIPKITIVTVLVVQIR